MKALRSDPPQEPGVVLRRIETSGWALLLLMSAGATLVFPFGHALGIAAGGVLSLVNFRCMDIYFTRLFRRDVARPKWWHHVLYAARFLGVMAAVAFAFAWGGLPVVSLVVGLSVPLMAIFLYGTFAALKGKTPARV